MRLGLEGDLGLGNPFFPGDRENDVIGQRMGLPPTPIDNPGEEAMRAAVNPPAGDWLYFVTVKPGDTRFTASAAQHQKNVEEFNKYQREHKH